MQVVIVGYGSTHGVLISRWQRKIHVDIIWLFAAKIENYMRVSKNAYLCCLNNLSEEKYGHRRCNSRWFGFQGKKESSNEEQTQSKD